MSDKDFKVKNKLIVNGLNNASGVVLSTNNQIDSHTLLPTQYGGTGTTTSPNAGQVLYSSSGSTYAPTTLSSLLVSGFVAQTTAPVDTNLLWLDTDEAADTTKLSFNAQTGTSYTLILSDAGNLVTLSNTGAITVTIPPNIFTTGQIINLQQINTGQVTFAQGAGVTITSTGATATAPKLRTRYSGCTVICLASNSFTIVGDLV